MKNKIISGIKIYLCCFIFIILLSFIYAFYLMKTGNNSNVIIELLIGASSFLLLGLLYSNMIHKRGIIVGLLTSIFHILLIALIVFLTEGYFSLKLLPSLIYITSSSLGGSLGIIFKKII